ncbi:MAG: zinc-binding dehydrogenase [Candidatus Omnitrophota bacterium]
MKYQRGDGFVEIRDVPVPVPKEDEILIKVSACGICGSDLHILHDQFPNNPPVIMGHELSGTIVELGSQVSNWFLNDRVVTELHTSACGRCTLCRTGNQHICPDKQPLGSKTDGGFAEYIKVPVRLIHRIPDSVDLVEAALTEPIAICIHALSEFGRIGIGDFVVILGPGPIGIISALIARKMGASQVVLCGTNKDQAVRLKVAHSLGVDTIINVERENLLKVIEDLTGGVGADVVVEASGAPPAIRQGIKICRRQGTFIAIGLTQEKEISLAWNEGIIKETKILMPFSSTWTSWELALQVLSQGIIKAKYLTNYRPLKEWQKAFQDLEESQVIKTLLLL